MNQTPPDAGSGTPQRVGEQLAAARRDRQLSIADVAARTRVPARHLEAIEGGRNDQLPALPYAVGFVRTYARMLQLDAEAMARDFRQELGREPAADRYVPDSFEPADPARVPPRLLVAITLLAALLLIVGYAAWRSGMFGGDTPDERARLAAAAEPAVTPAAGAATAAVAPAPAGGAVVLTAIEPVWLRIYEANGPTLVERQFEPGESWTVPASAANPQILTGRPQAVRVTVDGRAVAPLGRPERSIRDVSLRPADLLARGSGSADQAGTPPPTAAPAPAPAPAPEPTSDPARDVPPAFRDAPAPANASGL